MERTYDTQQLVDKLFENLRAMAPAGTEYSYTVGYLKNALKDITTYGVDELVSHVDWTNQRVEALEIVNDFICNKG